MRTGRRASTHYMYAGRMHHSVDPAHVRLYVCTHVRSSESCSRWGARHVFTTSSRPKSDCTTKHTSIQQQQVLRPQQRSNSPPHSVTATVLCFACCSPTVLPARLYCTAQQKTTRGRCRTAMTKTISSLFGEGTRGGAGPWPATAPAPRRPLSQAATRRSVHLLTRRRAGGPVSASQPARRGRRLLVQNRSSAKPYLTGLVVSVASSCSEPVTFSPVASFVSYSADTRPLFSTLTLARAPVDRRRE